MNAHTRLPSPLALREIGHITALRKALQEYETTLIAGGSPMFGSPWIAVVNAMYDMTELPALYHMAEEARDDFHATQPDPRDTRRCMVVGEDGRDWSGVGR